MLRIPIWLAILGVSLLIGFTAIAVLTFLVGIINYSKQESKTNAATIHFWWAVQDRMKERASAQ